MVKNFYPFFYAPSRPSSVSLLGYWFNVFESDLKTKHIKGGEPFWFNKKYFTNVVFYTCVITQTWYNKKRKGSEHGANRHQALFGRESLDDLSSVQTIRLRLHDLAQIVQQGADQCHAAESARLGCFGSGTASQDVGSAKRAGRALPRAIIA